MSSESVKICDLELEKLGDVAKCWDDIELVLGEYVAILKTVATDTVKAGHIHDALDRLYWNASDLDKHAQGLGAQVAGHARKLASKAEEIDLELYNEV